MHLRLSAGSRNLLQAIGNKGIYWGYIHVWIMEEKMETIVVYWGDLGIMEKNGNYYIIVGYI